MYTFESAPVHGNDLNRIVWRLFTIQAGHCRFDDSRLRLDLEDGHARVLVNDVLLDGIGQFGVGSFVGIVVIDRRHRHDHHAGRPVFRHIAQVDAVREEWRIVVDVLQIDLDVGVTHKSLAFLVLGEHGETPLGTSVGLIAIQWLFNRKKRQNKMK